MIERTPKFIIALAVSAAAFTSAPDAHAIGGGIWNDEGEEHFLVPERTFVLHADMGQNTKYDQVPTTFRYTLKVYQYYAGTGQEAPSYQTPKRIGIKIDDEEEEETDEQQPSEWTEAFSQSVISNSRTCTFSDVPLQGNIFQYVAIVEAVPPGSDEDYAHPNTSFTFANSLLAGNEPIEILINDESFRNDQYERMGAQAGYVDMGGGTEGGLHGDVDITVPCITTGVRVVTDPDYLAALPAFDHFQVSYLPLSDQVQLCAPNQGDAYADEFVRDGMNELQLLEVSRAPRITFNVPKPVNMHSNGMMTLFYDYMLSPNSEDLDTWDIEIKCIAANGSQVGTTMTAPMTSHRGYNNLIMLDMPQPAITTRVLDGKGVGVHVKRHDHGLAVYNNTCATMVKGTGKEYTLKGVRLEPYMHSAAGTYPKMDIKFLLEGSKLTLVKDAGKNYQTVPAYDDNGNSMGVRYLAVLDPSGHDIGSDVYAGDEGEELDEESMVSPLRAYTWTHWAQRYGECSGQIFSRPNGVKYVHFNLLEGPLTYTAQNPEEFDNTAYVASANTADNMPIFNGLDLYLYAPNTTVVYTDNRGNRHTVKGKVDFFKRGSGQTFDDGHNLHMVNIFGEGWPLKDANGVERPVYGDIDWDNLLLTIPRQPITPDLRHRAIWNYEGPEWGNNVMGRIGAAFMPTVDASARTMLQGSDGGDISMRLTSQYQHDDLGHPITYWEFDCGGQLSTSCLYTAETIQPWNTVCGTSNANGLGWHSLRLTPFRLGNVGEDLRITNDFQQMGYRDDTYLYVKGQLRITDNAHLLDYVELFAVPGRVTRVLEDDGLCTEDGIEGAVNITNYVIDWNLDGADVLDVMQNRGTGVITYNQRVPASVLKSASCSSGARAQAVSPSGFTLFAKAHYVHDALAPTFHALASRDQVTTDLDDVLLGDDGVFSARAGHGYLEVTTDGPVSIHTPAGACVYSGDARRLDMPSGIYVVSDHRGHSARVLVK